MSLDTTIESILFVSSKPLSRKKLAELTESKMTEVEEALDVLAERYSKEKSGIVLIRINDSVQFATNPAYSSLISSVTKEDVAGELTRAALETLSVIAYRGPVLKNEIEHIRGVNCSQSLRNLLIRGLVEVSGERNGEKTYSLTFDFMRLLGVASVRELPDFAALSKNEKVDALLADVLPSTHQVV